jgi:hypothetical protein
MIRAVACIVLAVVAYIGPTVLACVAGFFADPTSRDGWAALAACLLAVALITDGCGVPARIMRLAFHY